MEHETTTALCISRLIHLAPWFEYAFYRKLLLYIFQILAGYKALVKRYSMFLIDDYPSYFFLKDKQK